MMNPTLRIIMKPYETNFSGTIFGGIILSHIDSAGYLEARKHAKKTFVTISMKEVIFHAPVYVGDVVSFYTETLKIGRTSVTVKVCVYVDRINDDGKNIKVTEAECTFVCIDDLTRKAIPIKD